MENRGDGVPEGTVERSNAAKGCGFVTPDDDTADVVEPAQAVRLA